jgi:hypothetical protein
LHLLLSVGGKKAEVPGGVEFLLAATARNLRKLAKLITIPQAITT